MEFHVANLSLLDLSYLIVRLVFSVVAGVVKSEMPIVEKSGNCF
jgi:hypothetical protein